MTQQRVEAHVDLGLAGGGHLVVLDLDLDAETLHGEDHLGTQVLEVVRRAGPGSSPPWGGSCSRGSDPRRAPVFQCPSIESTW